MRQHLNLPSHLTQILERVKQEVLHRYPDRAEVWLYGSYARGEAGVDSDIDVLIVVDDNLQPSEVRQALSELLFDILLSEGELVSVCVMRRSDYYKRETPFLHSVRHEAISV